MVSKSLKEIKFLKRDIWRLVYLVVNLLIKEFKIVIICLLFNYFLKILVLDIVRVIKFVI